MTFLPRWLRLVWIGFPVAAVLLAMYAGRSNCAAINDAAARAECGESSGVVIGMTLGFLLFVWLLAPVVYGVLAFLAGRLRDLLSTS